MAQEFVVLQCCQCRTYQVQQSKKATKWLCKICNQKQSFKQFFGRGSAKDCRFAVQTLNKQQFGGPTIEGVLMDVNDSNHTNNEFEDLKILDLILAAEDNCDSNDDMSVPKKQKMTEEVDENIESKHLETKKSFVNKNQTFGRRVSKWSQTAK